MKYSLLLSLMLSATCSVHAQTSPFRYVYEESGNRVRRIALSLDAYSRKAKSATEYSDSLSLTCLGRNVYLLALKRHDDGTEAKVTVRDVYGHVAFSGEMTEGRCVIDLTGVPTKGLYVVTCECDGKSYSRKVEVV